MSTERGAEGNKGIIVSGGSLDAQSVAAGDHAVASTVNIVDPARRADLTAGVDALLTTLREHRDELPDPDAAVELATEVAGELRRDRPAMARVRDALTQLAGAAGSVTAVAEAVTAVQAIAGLG